MNTRINNLILSLLSLMLSNVVYAQNAFEENDIAYEIVSNTEEAKEVKVIAKENGSYYDNITIPSKVAYNGIEFDVTEISTEAFKNTTIRSISLPSSLKIIGASAFEKCEYLSTIDIPNSVTEIGEYAFKDCEELEKIYLSKNVSEIKKGIFNGLKNLKAIYYRMSSIANVEKDIFSSEMNLHNITTYIPFGCRNNYADKQLALSRKVRVFNPDDLNELYCTVTIETKGIGHVLSENQETDYAMWDIKKGEPLNVEFSGITDNTIIDFRAGTDKQSLSRYTLNGNTYAKNALTSDYVIVAHFYDKAKIITENAYRYEIIDEDKVKLLAPEQGEYGDIYFGNSIMLAGKRYKLAAIEDYACYSCTHLYSINLPETVTDIGEYAFYNCSNITGMIAIPKGVEEIKIGTFIGCDNTESIYLPSTIKYISDKAFDNCHQLSTLYINAATPPIVGDEDKNFTEYGMNGYDFDIINVLVPSCSKSAYQESPFWKNFAQLKTNNKTIEITVTPSPNGTIEVNGEETASSISIPMGGKLAIKATAAEGYILSRLDIGLYCGFSDQDYDTFTYTIEEAAYEYGITIKAYFEEEPQCFIIDNFRYCKRENKQEVLLTHYYGTESQINIPKEVTYHKNSYKVVSIREEAFKDNTNIQKVVLPEGLSEISSMAFSGCKNLEEINLPSTLTYLGDRLFAFTKIKEFVIPNGITYVYGSTFDNCVALKKIIMPQSLVEIRNSFDNCSDLEEVYFNTRTEINISSSCFDESIKNTVKGNPTEHEIGRNIEQITGSFGCE